MKIPTEPLYRAATLKRSAVDIDSRTVELSFSSEEPYERIFGNEILGHSEPEVRMTWITSGRAPLLLNHDPDKHIGVIETAKLSDSKGKARARLGRSPLAEEVLRDLADGIRVNVSVGYRVHKAEVIKEREDGLPDVRVVDWEPFEVSIVSIPADKQVGIGRSSTRSIKPNTNMKNLEVIELDPERQADAHAERTRCQDIAALGAKYKLGDLAERAITDGMPIQLFRQSVLDEIEKRGKKDMPTLDGIGLSAKEQKQYSLVRAINGMIAQKEGHSNPWRDAGLEKDVSSALEKERGHDGHGGILVPGDTLIPRKEAEILTRSAGDPLGFGTGNSTGANLVGTDHRGDLFIEALRNRVVTTRLGVRMLPGLQGQVDIPKSGAQPSFAWVGEDADPGGSDVDLGKESLSFKTLGSWQRLTRRLLKQSSPYVEDLIRGDLIAGAGLGIQNAIINGTGSNNQPKGILSLSSLATVALGTNGAAPDWDAIVDLMAEVSNDNADTGSLGFVTNSKVRAKLLKTQKFSGTDGSHVWGTDGNDGDGMGRLAGLRAAVTNAVPSNLTKGSADSICSAIIFGNFADILVGMWGGVELVVDTATHSATGGVVVRIWQDADVTVRHEESFSAILDALTS